MLEYAILLAVAMCTITAIKNWHLGIWLCIAVGFAQDPLRKIVEGQPAYMVTLVAIVFLGTIGGLVLRNYRFNPATVPGWKNGIAQAMLILAALIVLQMANAYVRYQSLAIVGFGALQYFAPILAVFAGYYFGSRFREQGIDNLLTFYSLFCFVSAFGIYLEFFGMDIPLLGEVGGGLVIYDLGTVLNPFSGLFRASEIAAWHIFFGSSCMMILAVRSRSIPVRWMWIAALVLLIAAGVLTGRRKLVVTVTIFVACYWLLLLVFIKRAYRLAVIMVLLAGASLWVASRNDLLDEKQDDLYGLYVERASSVFGDIGERAQVFGIEYVVNSIRSHGLFGKGVGVASQGTRFVSGFGGGFGEAESGLARIVVEIGLFGFMVIFWLIIVMIVNAWRIMNYLAYRKDSFATTCYGLVAILVANFAHFIVASQVFSDPFILILLGLVLGIIMASPTLVYLRDWQVRAPGAEVRAT